MIFMDFLPHSVIVKDKEIALMMESIGKLLNDSILEARLETDIPHIRRRYCYMTMVRVLLMSLFSDNELSLVITVIGRLCFISSFSLEYLPWPGKWKKR